MERAGATASFNNTTLWLWVPGRASLARTTWGEIESQLTATVAQQPAIASQVLNLKCMTSPSATT
ncbi:hypothetical protein ACVISU_002894 [Bradyrhizobium sp. USDA 4452]